MIMSLILITMNVKEQEEFNNKFISYLKYKIYNYMGNLIALQTYVYIDMKPVSKILELEGWELVYKNDTYIYYNKYKKIELGCYPISVSNYEDIIGFYNTELLNPLDTIELLKHIINTDITLMEEDVYKINNVIEKIKKENNLTEYNHNFIGLCFS